MPFAPAKPRPAVSGLDRVHHKIIVVADRRARKPLSFAGGVHWITPERNLACWEGPRIYSDRRCGGGWWVIRKTEVES